MSWQTKIQTTGLRGLWQWQEETLATWESDHAVVWAFFPEGGGRGVCGLLAAWCYGRPTVVIGPDAQWLAYRLELAAELNIPVVVWDGVAEIPPDVVVLLDLSTMHDDSWCSILSSGSMRLVIDSIVPSIQSPSWWDLIRSMPHLSLPKEDTPSSWWNLWFSENPAIRVIRVPVESKNLQWETWSVERPVALLPGSLVLGELDNVSVEETALSCAFLPKDGASRHEMLYDHAKEYYGAAGDGEIPVAMPDPERVIFAKKPHSLCQLGMIGRRCSHIFLPTVSDNNTPAISSITSKNWVESLQRWLTKKSQSAKTSVLYVSSSELLQALGQPVAPQPVFEQGIQELNGVLQQLVDSGWLRRTERVFFQANVHNVQKFQPVFLRDYPALMEFYEAYQSMLSHLPPLESLKLSFKSRQLDLRELAARLPTYDVFTLNQLFRQLRENKLAILELHTAPEHQRLDQEYQLELSRQNPASPAISWWYQSGEHRTSLLWASLCTGAYFGQDTLESLLSSAPQSVEFWQTAHHLFTHGTLLQKQRWAGRVLRAWEHGVTGSCLALWELLSVGLEIPGIGPQSLLAVLPPVRDMATADPGVFQPVFDRYHKAADLPAALYDYVLALPSSVGLTQWIVPYLEQKSPWVLQRQTAEQHHRELQQYVHLAQQMIQQSAATDSAVDRGVDAKEGHPMQLWSYATAWAFHLLKQPQQAWLWIAQASPETADQALLCATIAIDAKQPVVAQSWVEHAGQGHLFLSSELAKELGEQNFLICKAQARCKRCVLYGSSYCAKDLLERTQDRDVSGVMGEHLEYMLSKRIRANVEGYEVDHWRQMLQSSMVQRSQRIQRSLLQHLAQAGQATVEELRKLAQWAESYGDIQHAQSYRETLRQMEPDDALNLQKLADLYMRQEKSLDALRVALAATHAHPRKYPLELWLEQYEHTLFGSPTELRQALLELPAHPAFTKLEEKLSHLEAVMRELKPQLEQAERALVDEKWAEAQRVAQQALERYPEHVPVRFREILQDSKQREDQLWQTLRRLPKVPQERNKMLEELAQNAEKHGLHKLTEASYRKLLQLNPQYGLGYLKWARVAQDPEQRREAYQKAVELSRSPQQMKRNLEEYIQVLDQAHDLPRILPKLLDMAAQEGDETFSPSFFEKLFLRLVQQYGTQANVTESIREFLAGREKNKVYQQLQRKITEYDKMEPWKRALLSLKSQE